MELLYKPDWEGTRQRMTAWWVHEDIGRCAKTTEKESKNKNSIERGTS